MNLQQYLDMCEQMGWEPDEDNMPTDFATLKEESQHAVNLFNMLPDKIEGMSGTWLGKDYSCLEVFMNIFEIENRREVFERMLLVHKKYAEYYKEQRKAQETRSRNSAKVRR